MDKQIKTMRKESKTSTPDIIIGKNGLTQQVISNITDLLSKNKFIKIKILPTYISSNDKKTVFEDIAHKTNAKIVHTLGFTITLTKR